MTKLVFETHALIARMAALIPRPGFNLKRFYGVYASNHPLRTRITPVPPDPGRADRPTAPKRPKAMPWADLMARVFRIDALKCPLCEGWLRFVADIRNPDVIDSVIAALILSGRFDTRRLGRAPPSSPKIRRAVDTT